MQHDGTGSMSFSRRPGVWLALIILAQLAFALPRIQQPFIDGIQHWYFDNAAFLRRAVHSLDDTIPSAWKVFGLAEYEFDESNQPVGIQHYSHHGVLLPTLLRAWVALLGPTEFAVGSYMLLLSIGSTILMFNILRRATRDVGMAGIITLLYVMLPIKFMYMDKMKYEVVVEFMLLLCIYLLGRIEDGRPRARAQFMAALALTFHTEFSAFGAAALLVIYLFAKRRSPGFERLYLYATAACMVGVVTTFAVQYMLGFDPAAISSMASFRMSLETLGSTPLPYIQRQFGFLTRSNLGITATAVGLGALVYLCVTRKIFNSLTAAAGVILIVSTLAWLIVMRNHSFIHHFAQWNFAPAYALLLGAVAGTLQDRAAWTRSVTRGCVAIAIPVILLCAYDTYRANKNFRNAVRGTAADIELIQSVDRRLVIMPDGRSGQIAWWTSPVIRLYTDPIYRKSTRVGVVQADAGYRPDPDRDLVVMINARPLWEEFEKTWREEFGVATLNPVHLSDSFAFFELVMPANPDVQAQ